MTKPNTPQILRDLALHLELNVPDREFNMVCVMHDFGCGTVGCILGHGAVAGLIPGISLAHNTKTDSRYLAMFGGRYATMEDQAAALGITYQDLRELCYPLTNDRCSRTERIAMLREYATRYEESLTCPPPPPSPASASSSPSPSSP